MQTQTQTHILPYLSNVSKPVQNASFGVLKVIDICNGSAFSQLSEVGTKDGAATHRAPLRAPLELVPFTGKEKDSETGFCYFGARYYDSDLSGLFLSIDPMADKYPSLSPYNYCAWNPVKLVDPDGDTIKNAYEQYKDISKDVEYYQTLIKNTSDPKAISEYQNELAKIEDNNKKYNIVNELLEKYKTCNEKEYNRMDNISFRGKAINIIVSLSDDAFCPIDGAVGKTTITYLKNKNNRIIGLDKNTIRVNLYGDGFRDGFNGVGTLANEFGDIIFAITRPKYNNKTNNMGLKYQDIPTTKYSFDYENYITSQSRSRRPNPWSY